MLHHHQPKHDPGRVWAGKLQPELAALRESLETKPPEDLCRRSGATFDGRYLSLKMLFEDFEIDSTDYSVTGPEGSEVDEFLQSLVVAHLATVDDTPPTGHWVTFRELPNGHMYSQALQGSGPDRLARRWQLDLAGFEGACRTLGGVPFDLGDAGYVFTVLPRVDLGVVYWLGDEDLPSRASLLFDSAAHRRLRIEGLAVLGSRLVDRILDVPGDGRRPSDRR
jgi:hypothetical protein